MPIMRIISCDLKIIALYDQKLKIPRLRNTGKHARKRRCARVANDIADYTPRRKSMASAKLAFASHGFYAECCALQSFFVPEPGTHCD